MQPHGLIPARKKAERREEGYYKGMRWPRGSQAGRNSRIELTTRPPPTIFYLCERCLGLLSATAICLPHAPDRDRDSPTAKYSPALTELSPPSPSTPNGVRRCICSIV